LGPGNRIRGEKKQNPPRCKTSSKQARGKGVGGTSRKTKKNHLKKRNTYPAKEKKKETNDGKSNREKGEST